MGKRIIQLDHVELGRALALVDEPHILILDGPSSVYELFQLSQERLTNIEELIDRQVGKGTLEYDAVYEGNSDWRILPAFDHPENPYACLVSGTGLTHKNSALNRQAMHSANNTDLNDSIKMYSWGEKGGKPDTGRPGTQPEWFYKGNGYILRGHNQPLDIPGFADDGGEEPEIAIAYIVDGSGQPFRIGFCIANEFSDHKMEKKNYLYLAPSKLRYCSIGPELVLNTDFQDITGTVQIKRDDRILWEDNIRTGEANMVHHLANLEHHHFKYPEHRRPGMAHIHFLGADSFSYGSGIVLKDGDEITIGWSGLGRPLQNKVRMDSHNDLIFTKQFFNHAEKS